MVDVTATSIPVGEKVVKVTLRTDSPVDPEITLTVKVVGIRKPPFLFLPEGEAVFRGEFKPGMAREIAVLSIEGREQGPSPIMSVDLPFLKINFVGVDVKPYVSPDTLLRRWKYLVEVKERPPSGSFGGTITASSPWDPRDQLTFNVVGQLQSGLRAVPSVITLDPLEKVASPLLVFCNSPSASLSYKMDENAGVSLQITEGAGGNERRVHRLAVNLTDSTMSGVGQTNITIENPSTSEKIVVPVVIRTKMSSPVH